MYMCIKFGIFVTLLTFVLILSWNIFYLGPHWAPLPNLIHCWSKRLT